MTTPSPKKSFSLMKLYLTLVSLAGIIGIVVVYGQMLHSVVSYHLIDDAEYVQGRRSWEIDNCESPKRDNVREREISRSQEDIASCKEEAEERVLSERRVEYKESLIAGFTRGVLFVLLFITHFVVFYRSYKKSS